MGILRHREELLPVTCAVLKEDDREYFFSQLQRKGASAEKIAKAYGASDEQAQDWFSGKMNVPYHVLQKLSADYGVELPQITELRRESQPVLKQPALKHQHNVGQERAQGEGRKQKRQEQRGARGGKGQPQQQSKQRRGGEQRGDQRNRQQPQQRKEGQQQGGRRGQKCRQDRPQQAQGGRGERGPALSTKLAYWIGIYASSGSQEGRDLEMIWNSITEELFGPATDADKLQSVGAQTGSIPRWVWSNPEWKLAFQRGVTDACGFLEAEELVIQMPDSLIRATAKILGSIGVTTEQAQGTVTIRGEHIERYFTTVGTENPRLKEGAPAQAHAAPREAEKAEPPNAQTEPAEAAKSPVKKPVRSRKILFHGRPSRRK